jgi:endonuclease/exonuclease/phosphatase family metal-dependent hydrolase
MTNYIKTLVVFILLMSQMTMCSSIPRSGSQPEEQTTGRGYYYPAPDEGVLRILSYNIRNCIGMDGETDFQRVADVIMAINPHVVGLQEVDKGTVRLERVDVAAKLAELTGMHYYYSPSIEYQGGLYGNAVLTRVKPVNHSFIPLPGRQERRSLQMVEFENYILYNTHLSNTDPGDRHGSVMIIDYETRDSEKPIFLIGDINDTPGSMTLQLFSGNWEQLSGNDPTAPSNRPRRCIDYIFGLKGFNYKVLQQVVVNEPVASDHRPVFVDVIIE